MSSEHQPLDTTGRHQALRDLGITQVQLAQELGVTQSQVSRVITGDRGWGGAVARRIMAHIAGKLDLPLDVVFPGSERRKGVAA